MKSPDNIAESLLNNGETSLGVQAEIFAIFGEGHTMQEIPARLFTTTEFVEKS